MNRAGPSSASETRQTFCRLIIHGADDPLVDLAPDSSPQQPATASLIGPTFAPEELAGRQGRGPV